MYELSVVCFLYIVLLDAIISSGRTPSDLSKIVKREAEHVGSRGVVCLRGRIGTQGRGGGHWAPRATRPDTREGFIIARRPVETKVRRAGGSRQRGGAPLGRGGRTDSPDSASGAGALEFSTATTVAPATTTTSTTTAASRPSTTARSQPTVGGTHPFRFTDPDDPYRHYASIGEQQLSGGCDGTATTVPSAGTATTKTKTDEPDK